MQFILFRNTIFIKFIGTDLFFSYCIFFVILHITYVIPFVEQIKTLQQLKI